MTTTETDPKQAPAGLRQDVRFLTTLLGDVIREQEGEALFKKIEEIRNLAKNIRQNPKEESIADQKRMIRSLSLDQAYKVARAFTIYFQVVNIAEEMQRVRRIREYEKNPSLFQDMSLHRLFHDLKEQKIPAAKVSEFLAQMRVELVLTAHPTEAKRRTVLDHLLRIASQIGRIHEPDLTVSEKEEAVDSIKQTLEILWQTAEIRQRKVEVLDEVDQTLFYFQRTILDLLPRLERKIRREFRSSFGQQELGTGSFIRFGSWVGSDRDGNPYVTCAVTKKTAALQRRLVLRRYLTILEDLIRKHSQSREVAEASEALLNSLKEDARLLPGLAHDLGRYEASEIYRKKFSFMHGKLESALYRKKPGYTAESFLKDLSIVRDSFLSHRAALSAADVDFVIDQVRVFGFHLARLNFRDHSGKLRQAFAEIFPGQPFEETVILKKILTPVKSAPAANLSVPSKDLLDQLETIRWIQAKEDPAIVGDYILSMTESTADVLALFYLARQKGLIRTAGPQVKKSSIGIIPLFESIASLDRASEVMDRLYSIPVYKSYVESCGGVQTVMLGYSDSSKDGGYLTANWKIHVAQKKLAEVTHRHGFRLEIFHGKGGTIDRGGGESHKAILAQPDSASDGRLRITEQGEVIAQKYANPVIAERNLEQLLTAVVWTNLVSKSSVDRNPKIPVWEDRIRALSDLSFRYYRKLIHETPGFLDFYYEATPIQVLKMTKIGSRPAARSSRQDFSELRAIPWVFSWVQSRYILSAWYGTGWALESYVRERGDAGLAELREMYDQWPFFRSIIQNVQTSLAKTDLHTAAQYAELVKDAALGGAIHGELTAEYERAVSRVLQISSQKELLDFHRVLRDSIRLRNPYVDPLNYLQIRFLGELKDADASIGEEERKKMDEILLLTVNGIAFGMKSTG